MTAGLLPEKEVRLYSVPALTTWKRERTAHKLICGGY